MTLEKIKSYMSGWIQLFRYLSIEKEDKDITFDFCSPKLSIDKFISAISLFFK